MTQAERQTLEAIRLAQRHLRGLRRALDELEEPLAKKERETVESETKDTAK